MSEKDEFIIKKLIKSEATKKYSQYTPEKENESTRQEDLITTSDFPKHRALVSRAFKDALVKILDECSPKNSLGIEYGCGSYAYLFTMIPDRFKENWKIYDVNPKVVDHANKILKEAGYKNRVKLGDIYNISKTHSNAPLIFGLSSWDSSFNLEKSMTEVFKALSDDGVFIHIQDLFPGKEMILGREWKRRHEHGINDEPIEYECYKTDQWCATKINSKVFGWISTIQSFVVELSAVCRNIGFKDVNWGYREGNFVGERLQVHEYFKDVNFFHRVDTDYEFGYDDKLPKNYVHEKIEFLVLTAKK